MNREEFKRFGSAYEATCAMYGNKFKPSAETIAMAFHALADMPLDIVLDAFGRHIRDPNRGQFFPKPADLIFQAQVSIGDRAMLAWDKVHGAIVRVGQYSSVVFDDPAIHAVVDGMGGWVKMTGIESGLPMQNAERAFAARYRLYAANPPASYPRILGGVIGAEGIAYIGDRDRALQVERGGGSVGLAITRDPRRVLAKAIASKGAEV